MPALVGPTSQQPARTFPNPLRALPPGRARRLLSLRDSRWLVLIRTTPAPSIGRPLCRCLSMTFRTTLPSPMRPRAFATAHPTTPRHTSLLAAAVPAPRGQEASRQ
jgi:hypothetical protein